MSLCPDTRVNTDQELLLRRLASPHVYHSPADYCSHEVTAKKRHTFADTLQLRQGRGALATGDTLPLLGTEQRKAEAVGVYSLQDVGV